MNISELVMLCHDRAIEAGWWEDPNRNTGELLMLCVTELAEAMEEYRLGIPLDLVYYRPHDSDKPEGFPIEIADVLIRIADLCGRYDIDIEKAINTKMEYNKTRSFRHGNKKA